MMAATTARWLGREDTHDEGYHDVHAEYSHDVHAEDSYGLDDHDGHLGRASSGQNTLDLRITAIFVILLAGLIGGLIPLFIKSLRKQSHPATLLLRAMAAGIILALALIHVIPEGSANLEDLVDYPVAPCCVAFGIIIMVAVENMSRHFLSSFHTDLHTHGHSHAHGHSHTESEWMGNGKRDATLCEGLLPTHDGHAAMPSPSEVTSEHKEGLNSDAGHSVGGDLEHAHSRPDLDMHVCAVSGMKMNETDRGSACEREHAHACIAVTTAANFAANASNTVLTHQIVAYLFEFACIVHSVLIGFALGVTVDDRGQALALLVALLFHQLFEGVGLGTVIIKARFRRMKAIFMVVTFSLMMPIGVAIGIGVASTYDAGSTVSKAVQGVLNSISGGLLLYIALVQMIAEDFTKTDRDIAGGWIVRISSYLALALGAVIMAVIAIFEGDSHGHK